MNSKRLKIRVRFLLIGLFLVMFGGTAHAQFVINGFGLSGGVTALDSIVEAGDPVSVVLTVDVPEGWTLEGVGIERQGDYEGNSYGYSDPVPFGDPSTVDAMRIDIASVVIDSGVDPQIVRFTANMPEQLALNLRSMQMSVGVFGRDSEGELRYSLEVVSFIDAGELAGINNPVDAQHRPYLGIEHAAASRPTITSPGANTTVGRLFTLEYDQPFDAVSRSLILVIQESPESGGTINHTLFLADTLAGDDKQLVLNSLNLGQSDGVDSLVGPTSLNHRSLLTLQLYYTVAGEPGQQTDPSIVGNVFADLRTEIPVFTEPRVGSESPAPDIRVIYRLLEEADSVQVVFALDSLSILEDPFSPHIVTLAVQHNGRGEHYLILDGTNLGTGGPNVLHNNNGPNDQLINQALYNVSLSYGDIWGNPAAVVTNNGYIWPEDLTTVPGQILAPVSNSSDNNSFWVQFSLPESPLVGSVYLWFSALPSYPGSPHTIHLGELASGGIHGLYLNAQALDLSGVPVTSVEGGNQFRHNSLYSIRVAYRDHYGNDEAVSTPRLARYDGATETPTIFAPFDNDTLRFFGTEVSFSQPEHATPGTVQLVLEQTGGPEPDLLSPHTMFLSNSDSGFFKTVSLQPGFIGPGPGIDSVQNAGSLVARGRYKLTVAYQDVLLNAPGSVFVRNLYFPSGSSVFVSGSSLNTSVIPGATNVPLIQFSLSSSGQSALRGLKLGVVGSVVSTDVTANRMILWSSVDSILQTGLDTPLDTLDSWLSGEMVWDSISLGLDETVRHVIVSGTFPSSANSSNSIHLVLQAGNGVDCGGDPVYCTLCPIGEPDVALPVLISSMYLGDDTTFSALVVNWIAESEYNTLGFRLWRSDNENPDSRIIASYASNHELYGRGNAAEAKRYHYTDRNLRNDLVYTYSIDAVGMDGLTVHPIGLTASGSPPSPPSNYSFRKIYPNPFNQETTIEFVVPFTEEAELTIYNLLGQEVRHLIKAQLAPSIYRTKWNGQNDDGVTMPSGLYLVRLRAAGRFDATQKILLIR